MKRVKSFVFWLFAILIMSFVSPGLTYCRPLCLYHGDWSGGVGVMDLAANSFVTGFGTGTAPIGIGVSTVNHRAYAANYGDGIEC